MTVSVVPWEGTTTQHVRLRTLPEDLELLDHAALVSLAAEMGVLVYGHSSKEGILRTFRQEAW